MITMLCFLIPAAVIAIPSCALAEKPPKLGWSSSLYSDLTAHKIGDVISIVVSESNSATKNTSTNTTKNNSAEAKGDPSTGALNGLFPGMGGKIDVSNQFNGSGSTVRNGTLNSNITVKVVDILPNYNLVVEGTKTIEVNEDIEVVTISGLIRPEDITAQNTILSYQVANAKITYKGSGTITKGNRPGFLTRVINWIL